MNIPPNRRSQSLRRVLTRYRDLDIRGFFGFDDAVRPGLSAIRVEVTVTGPESAGRYQELAAAVDRHCPVLDLFANPVPVTRTIAAPAS